MRLLLNQPLIAAPIRRDVCRVTLLLLAAFSGTVSLSIAHSMSQLQSLVLLTFAVGFCCFYLRSSSIDKYKGRKRWPYRLMLLLGSCAGVSLFFMQDSAWHTASTCLALLFLMLDECVLNYPDKLS